ncbi:hypothetical protein G6F65_016163 [Rhizopus arrhizus]|nr:hypothetical protein G6F65_016163 [Rhizopus arrhizus]
MRQVDDLAGHHGAAAQGRAAQHPPAVGVGRRPVGCARPPHQRLARQQDGNDLPGTDDGAEPGLPHRRTAHRALHPSPPCHEAAGARPRHRAAGESRHRVRRTAADAGPAPVGRRPAPARDDRHGADVRP